MSKTLCEFVKFKQQTTFNVMEKYMRQRFWDFYFAYSALPFSIICPR